MKGKQRREELMFACVRLEDLIPPGHILRKIDRWIDFSIIHEQTEDLYSSTGRPSIDPEEYLDKVELENPAEESLPGNTDKVMTNVTHTSRTDHDARIF